MKHITQITILVFLVFLIGGFIIAVHGQEVDRVSSGEPRTSYKYIIVYGMGDLNVGDVVEFFDQEGTLCGKWKVRDKSAYGLMPVYGDDPTTVDIDEGAREGEVLTIKVNGREVIASGSPPVYELEGETRRIDL